MAGRMDCLVAVVVPRHMCAMPATLRFETRIPCERPATAFNPVRGRLEEGKPLQPFEHITAALPALGVILLC